MKGDLFVAFSITKLKKKKMHIDFLHAWFLILTTVDKKEITEHESKFD